MESLGVYDSKIPKLQVLDSAAEQPYYLTIIDHGKRQAGAGFRVGVPQGPCEVELSLQLKNFFS